MPEEERSGTGRSIRFVTVEEAKIAHARQLTLFGGGDGLRDPGMLESAIHQPQQTFGGEYVYATIFEMAAAYWHGLTMNHPFVDGNKRVGVVVCEVFLNLNGYELTLSQRQVIDLGLELAQGNITREVLARIIDQSAVELAG